MSPTYLSKRMISALILVINVFVSLNTTQPARAISIGCAAWDSIPPGSTSSYASGGNRFDRPSISWDPSDVIKITVTGSGTGTLYFISMGSIPLSGPIAVPGVLTFSGPYDYSDSGNAFFVLNVTSGTLDYVASCGVPTSTTSSKPVFVDGRLNQDAGQTAAVYFQFQKDANGLTQRTIEIWAVVNGVGIKAVTVTQAELDAVDSEPTVNTLIKQGRNVRLYRLSTGELLLIGPSLDPTKPLEEYKFYFR